MNSMKSRLLAGVGVAVTLAGSLGAQERHVAWVAAAGPIRAVAPGSVVAVHLNAHIDPGWHVYSLTQGPGGPIPMRITLASGGPFALVDATGPKPLTQLDPNFGITVEMYDNTPAFAVRVRVDSSAAAGSDTVAIAARYQACSASLCLPPHTETVRVPITVARASAARASARASRPTG